MSNTKKNILLCGGGNAIHVLTAYIGSQPNYNVSVFSTFPGEADKLRAALPDEGIKCVNDLGPDMFGKPIKVSDKAEEVVPGSDVIILAIPSFTHEIYLRAVAPFVKPGVVIGAMPGEGGFDMCARHVLGADFVDQSNIFALETLPWACSIVVSTRKTCENLQETALYEFLTIQSSFLSSFRTMASLSRSWEPKRKLMLSLQKARMLPPNKFDNSYNN